MKKKVIFFGHNSFGIHVLKYLLRKKYEVPVIMVPPNSDREKINEIKSICPDSDIIESRKFTAQELAEKIKENGDCVLLSCSYKALIPREVVRLGIINIHGALLPEWRGANMLNWVIIKGCKKSGVTLHYMEETLDSGDIIDIIEYPLYPDDTIGMVRKRMFEKTTELLDRCWESLLRGELTARKQDHRLARYYPSRSPADGRINWRLNAIDIYNLVKALVYPYPGAFCFYKGQRIIIEETSVEIDNKPHFRPGKISAVDKDGHIKITTGYNLLVIKRVRDKEAFDRLKLHEGDRLD